MSSAFGFISGLLDRATSAKDETKNESEPMNASTSTYGSEEADASTPKDARSFFSWAAWNDDEHLDAASRIHYLENAKYLLMTLVVWQHALEDFLNTAVMINAETLSVRKTKMDVLEPSLPWIRALYLTLGAFAMPLFTAIVGFQSKSWLDIAREHDLKAAGMLSRVRKSTGALIGAWVLWQAIYIATEYVDVRPLQWWAPLNVTWFLLALWIWRNSILLIGGMKDGIIYGLVCGLAIAVGFTDTPTMKNGHTFLDWQRVCTFALYFYVGAVFVKREHFDRVTTFIGNSSVRITTGIMGLGLVYGGFMLSDYLGEPFEEVSEWLFTQKPYGFTNWYHPILECLWRILLFVGVAFCSVAFMCLVPRGEYFFTELGSRTLTTYLLHRVFITLYFDVMSSMWDDDDIDVVSQIVIGVFVLPLIVSQVTLSRPVTQFVAPLIDPASRVAGFAPWLFHTEMDTLADRERDAREAAILARPLTDSETEDDDEARDDDETPAPAAEGVRF